MRQDQPVTRLSRFFNGAGICVPISLRQSSDNSALLVCGCAAFVKKASAVLRQNLSSMHNGFISRGNARRIYDACI